MGKISKKCVNCGAHTKLVVGDTEMVCSYCGSEFQLNSSDFTPAMRARQITAYRASGYENLRNSNFKEAEKDFKKSLALDAEDDRSYLGLLMVKLKLTSPNDFYNISELLGEHEEFQRAIYLAPKERKSTYEEYRTYAADNYRIYNMDHSKVWPLLGAATVAVALFIILLAVKG